MDILYIWPQRNKVNGASGVMRKINMQLQAFQNYGLNGILITISTVRRFHKILSRIPFYESYRKNERRKILNSVTNDLKGIYIRKEVCDKSFIELIKEIHAQNKDAKIILEIPTYPYDRELLSLKRLPLLIKDRIHRKQLKKWVSAIAVLTKDKEIWNIPCVNIDNGIDCSVIEKRTPCIKKDSTIKLLAVAQIAKWHGYDRVIRGLGAYYAGKPDRKVEFHVVGDGTVVKDLKKLCHDLNVEQYVFFHGWMHGEALDDMFNQCDMGVGCLGVHRKGLTHTNSLKLREYAARGIPFFYSDIDLAMEKFFQEYLLNVPANDDPISIPDVIHFYYKMQAKGFDKIATEMHGLAEKNLSWTKQMKPVIDYILADDSEKDVENEG